MFHTILTISYLIPSVYLFIRIWQLFIPREWRLAYVIIYAIFFLVYPISNLAGGGDTGFAARITEAVANYLLPFFLYLFMIVLLTDLLLLLNLIFRIIPYGRIRKRDFRVKALVVIICLSMIIVIAGIINFNTIRTSEYKIDIDGGSSGIRALRIAFVSDFHMQENTPERFVEKYVQKIRSINPDLMLYGGDMVEGDGENENLKRFEELLSSIRTKFGVYGVLGNHEHYSGQDQGSFFDNAGIIILRDSAVVFNNSFILLGRNDSHTRDRKSIDELMLQVHDTIPVILLDHRPTEVEQVSQTRTDIQFSGHTHHGQLFPINLITGKVYQLSWGYMKTGSTHFFVSSGIRLWGPHVRTTGKSEIMVVDVNFVSDK